jgi:hypothetical protein
MLRSKDASSARSTDSHLRRMLFALMVVGLSYAAYSVGSILASPASGEIPAGVTLMAEREGFDSCESYPDEAMNTWAEKSPFSYVGTYLGGRNTPCETSKEWVQKRYAAHGKVQGWDFLPLWVGRQSPCSGPGLSQFSKELSVARSQAAEEVDLAKARAEKDGFTPGSIIYYDMEPWNTANAECSAAFRAYLNVWSKRLNEVYGFKAGVYGGDCAGGINQLASVEHEPNQVWLAHYWPKGTPKMESVYKVECVPQSHWENRRFHQWDGEYEGEPSRGYREYGGVKLAVDTDCAKGLVAGHWPTGQVARCVEQ